MAGKDRDIESIFHEAGLIYDSVQRAAFLDKACAGDEALRARVETLLAAEPELADFLEGETHESPVGGRAGSSSAPKASSECFEEPGSMIGRYKLLERIGEGGFGVVYMAEQEKPVRRRVALKIIKLGMDTRQVIARFEQERQALAIMDHPNIAKVLDGGATETGRPYFVMELVKGVPITNYCDANGLTPHQRLELFVSVCRAVQHAHQKGIIHRDIKPSNVLVTRHDEKPVVKVIDFGIAKATGGQLTDKTLFTEFRQLIGTPAYMSPEQAGLSDLDIDTRTDIYSLGVLLYELLTGTTPFDLRTLLGAGFAEIQRMIRESEPPKPSTRLSTMKDELPSVAAKRKIEPARLTKLVRGDLDWIVMKALEKDRTRRYDTANGLAMDIERYLRDEPVLASPPSAAYRVRKFARRNRGGVIAGTLVAAALVLGVIGTTWGMVWAMRERTRAEDQARLATAAAAAEAIAKDSALAAEAEASSRAEELQRVTEFQASQLEDIDTEQMGVHLRDSILEQRKATLAAKGSDAAAIEEGLVHLKSEFAGVNFTTVALASLEENIFKRALAAIDTTFADQLRLKAALLQTTASTMMNLGLLDAASAPQAEALRLRRMLLGDDHRETVLSLNQMGMLLKAQGRFAEAEEAYRSAMDASRRVLGPDDPDAYRAVSNMSVLLVSQGRFEKAEVLAREALEGYRRLLGDDDKDTLACINTLAVALLRQNRIDEAEKCYHEAVDGLRRTLGSDHPKTLTAISNMGVFLRGRGKFAEAEVSYREALEGRRRVLGDNHQMTLMSIDNMGGLMYSQGKYAEAEKYCRQAFEGRRRELGDDHVDTLHSVLNTGILIQRQGRLAEAELFFRQGFDGLRRLFGDDHPDTRNAMNLLATVRETQEHWGEAEPVRRMDVDAARRAGSGKIAELGVALVRLGTNLMAQEKYVEAEHVLTECLDIRRRVLPEDNWVIPNTRSLVGETIAKQGRYAEAEPMLTESAEWMLESDAMPSVEQLGVDRAGAAVARVVDLYAAWNAAEPAKGYDAKAEAWRAKHVPPTASRVAADSH